MRPQSHRHARTIGVLMMAMMALMACGGARAEPGLGAALGEFDRGAYARAAALAEQEGSPEGKTLAGWALLAAIDATADSPARLDLLARAEHLSRAALAEDPDLVQAMLQIDFVLGYRSRIEGNLAAFRKGWASEGKRLFQRAQKLQPENPWTYAVQGGWNTEIVLRGGGFLYGASVRTARQSFERAIRLDPANTVFPVQYAIALVRLDGRRYGAEAAGLLSAVATLRPRNEMERRAQAQGARLAAALVAGGPAVDAVLAEIVPFLEPLD